MRLVRSESFPFECHPVSRPVFSRTRSVGQLSTTITFRATSHDADFSRLDGALAIVVVSAPLWRPDAARRGARAKRDARVNVKRQARERACGCSSGDHLQVSHAELFRLCAGLIHRFQWGDTACANPRGGLSTAHRETEISIRSRSWLSFSIPMRSHDFVCLQKRRARFLRGASASRVFRHHLPAPIVKEPRVRRPSNRSSEQLSHRPSFWSRDQTPIALNGFSHISIKCPTPGRVVRQGLFGKTDIARTPAASRRRM